MNLRPDLEVWNMRQSEIEEDVAATLDENERERGKMSIPELLASLPRFEVELKADEDVPNALGLALHMLAYYEDQLAHFAWLLRRKKQVDLAELAGALSRLNVVFRRRLPEMAAGGRCDDD